MQENLVAPESVNRQNDNAMTMPDKSYFNIMGLYVRRVPGEHWTIEIGISSQKKTEPGTQEKRLEKNGSSTMMGLTDKGTGPLNMAIVIEHVKRTLKACLSHVGLQVFRTAPDMKTIVIRKLSLSGKPKKQAVWQHTMPPPQAAIARMLDSQTQELQTQKLIKKNGCPSTQDKDKRAEYDNRSRLIEQLYREDMTIKAPCHTFPGKKHGGGKKSARPLGDK